MILPNRLINGWYEKVFFYNGHLFDHVFVFLQSSFSISYHTKQSLIIFITCILSISEQMNA